MFVDLHGHTGGVSWCCKVDYKEILENAKEVGFDGIAITNHYVSNYFNDETHKDWVEDYIKEWHLCREYGKKVGVKIFCGIEVTMAEDERVHLLIFGADEAFLREHLFLNRMSQKELYALCKKHNCCLIQAHPFRNGSAILDTDYLDGLEINCHPTYKDSYAEVLLDAVKEHNLAVTVGCDYHADNYRPKGGTHLPDDIQTERDLAEYILAKKPVKLQVHEPRDGEIRYFEV